MRCCAAFRQLQIAAQLRPLLPLFNRYLLTGGFPETARQDDIGLCQRLLREDVVERVLKRDMTALFGVRNVNDLERLFIYLCLHTGGILAHNTVARDLETSAATVGNHLDLLRAANLVYCLPPIGMGGKKVLRTRNKYYLVDAALRNAVLLRGEEVLANPDDMGMIVETTILRHLYAYHYRDTPQIAYWRDAVSHKEVDIIVKSPAYHLVFEIKYCERASVDTKSGLALYSCRRSQSGLSGYETRYRLRRDRVKRPVHSYSQGVGAYLVLPAGAGGEGVVGVSFGSVKPV
ncbi:MAG TPA: DUF4143 domain-containing protein [Candidatus Competibacteraceae bacterium]|nr:DUF4143 domain-containing protein [Candidatus Competibacteraceae bacterium]MCP5135068.1 DUF4143 domain-containing protein [Gammaproteobacteria bacterium]HPF59163.1 DUF4143 domain-containing protein [Candidatus Competibacteraceae bacterium]